MTETIESPRDERPAGEPQAGPEAVAATSNGEDSPYARTIGRLLLGTNINEQTFLATDYLNHFNEIVMLLELVPDMPDVLEEAREWAPKTYEQHFRDSVFTSKDLAIFAYENAPARYRVTFDETVAQINSVVALGLERIEVAMSSNDEKQLREVATSVSTTLRLMMDRAGAIIHGSEAALHQDEIDQLLGT